MTAQLYALNEGWPFGDGPMRWFFRFAVRDDSQGIYAECASCPQGIFCVVPDTTKPGFSLNLELLKSRVADHVLKCHPEQAAS